MKIDLTCIDLLLSESHIVIAMKIDLIFVDHLLSESKTAKANKH